MLNVVNGAVPVYTLEDYFTSHSHLRIPAWQRDYSWDATDEGQVGVLIEDMQTFANAADATEYLMGSVILCEEGQDNHWLVIDGQQRSLTLSIFFMAALKFMKNKGLLLPNNPLHANLMSKLHKAVNAYDLGLGFKGRVVMNNPDADAIIKRIYDWCQLDEEAGNAVLLTGDPKTQSERNLVDVAQYIYRRFTSDSVFPEDKFIDAIKKILDSVKLVVLTLDNQQEALKVYDRINNRGMVLSSADLIKNIIFMNVADEDFDQVSANWLEMAKELSGTGKARLQDPKFLLKLLASVKAGTKVTYDSLVDFWGDELKEGLDPLAFASELPMKSKVLRLIASEQTMIPNNQVLVWGDELQKVVSTQLFIPHELGSVQHNAVLLAGMHLENPETLRRLMKQVHSRTLLYIYAQERTGQFESVVPVWAQAVSLLPSDAEADDLDSVYEAKAFTSENPIGLLATALENNMYAWDYQNGSDRKKIRSLFALLNIEVSNNFPAQELMRTRRKPTERVGWDIDHIMPKSLSPDGWVHKLGNLTLLAPDENNFASNTPAHKKIDDNVYANSQVVLTRMCDSVDKFTPLERNNLLDYLQKVNLEMDYKIDNLWDEAGANSRTKFLVKWTRHLLVERFKTK
jgi:hypothetical protein